MPTAYNELVMGKLIFDGSRSNLLKQITAELGQVLIHRYTTYVLFGELDLENVHSFILDTILHICGFISNSISHGCGSLPFTQAKHIKPVAISYSANKYELRSNKRSQQWESWQFSKPSMKTKHGLYISISYGSKQMNLGRVAIFSSVSRSNVCSFLDYNFLYLIGIHRQHNDYVVLRRVR